MPFTVKENRSYAQEIQQVYEAAQKAIAGLEGKSLSADAAAGTLHAQFDKKIHGKVLGDRSQILVSIEAADDGQTNIAIEAFPVNPVGQKLQFGARKGVVPRVISWFWAHLEHNLKKMDEG